MAVPAYPPGCRVGHVPRYVRLVMSQSHATRRKVQSSTQSQDRRLSSLRLLRVSQGEHDGDELVNNYENLRGVPGIAPSCVLVKY